MASILDASYSPTPPSRPSTPHHDRNLSIITHPTPSKTRNASGKRAMREPQDPEVTALGPAKRQGEVLEAVKDALNEWRQSTWLKSYSTRPWGAEGLMSDDILDGFATYARWRKPDDVRQSEQCPVAANWWALNKHGAEVLKKVLEVHTVETDKHEAAKRQRLEEKNEANRLQREAKKQDKAEAREQEKRESDERKAKEREEKKNQKDAEKAEKVEHKRKAAQQEAERKRLIKEADFLQELRSQAALRPLAPRPAPRPMYRGAVSAGSQVASSSLLPAHGGLSQHQYDPPTPIQSRRQLPRPRPAYRGTHATPQSLEAGANAAGPVPAVLPSTFTPPARITSPLSFRDMSMDVAQDMFNNASQWPGTGEAGPSLAFSDVPMDMSQNAFHDMPWPSAGVSQFGPPPAISDMPTDISQDAFCDVPAWLTVNASQAAGFNQTSGMYEAAPINYLSTPAQHQSLSASHYHTPVSQPPGHELQYTPGGDLPPFPPSRAPPPTPQHLLAPTASAGPPSAPLYWPAQFAPTQTPPARPSSRPMIFASQPPQSPARTPTMYALPPPPAWAPPPRATIPVLARNAGIPKRPHF